MLLDNPAAPRPPLQPLPPLRLLERSPLLAAQRAHSALPRAEPVWRQRLHRLLQRWL